MAKEQDAEQEPSIEEILDSIRQIISDDDDEAVEAHVDLPPPAAPKPDKDVIELTHKLDDEEEEEESIEVDMTESQPAPPPPPPKPRPKPAAAESNFDSLLTNKAEKATYEAFSELAERAAIERGGTVTIEDVVREEIKPMLREWLDRNLPKMVERLLQKELERISRRVQE